MRTPARALGLAAALACAAGAAPAPAPPPAPPPDPGAVVGLIEAGRLDEAERRLRDQLARRDDPLAHDLLGVVLARTGRAAEAERHFRQALQGGAAAADVRQHLARLYLEQQREAEALAELREAARQGVLEPDLGLKLADAERAAGRTAEAARVLRALGDQRRSVRALLELARLQAGERDPSAALETLGGARALAPNSEELLSAYAQVALAAQAPVPAILALEALARMHPDVAEYPYVRGVALMQAGDLPAAVESLQRADALEPDRALTLIALGIALNARKRYAEARPPLARGLELEPENADAAAALAEAEEGLGELAAAEEHARRALARAERHATANLVLGLLLMKQARHADARAALERAAEAEPGSAKTHYQLSLALARLGDAARAGRALATYRKSLAETERRLNELRRATGLRAADARPEAPEPGATP